MKDLGISKSGALNTVARAKKNGNLISPARGLYIIVPPEHKPFGSIPASELTPLLMEYLHADYYVSLLSAAALYGATHQKPAQFQIITNKRSRHPLSFGLVRLQLLYKKSLKNLPLRDFTVTTGYLKVASPELVVFDLLHYQERSGGLNHIATVLSELVERLTLHDLIQLAEQLDGKAWLQRLGFILEKLGTHDNERAAELSKKLLNHLQDKPLPYVALAPELPKKGYPRIKTWRIIENTTIESDL
ncbi:hypothetical protein H0X06_02375 [Candidatus Dependentiae bacterium]|nr:hypothetical protein [Candidatus Dependentiae bacterium]